MLTLMACPKKPLPRTSPWIRSHGRKICWEQLLEQRRDSERLMSRLSSRGSFGELGPGDLEMLLLRLRVRGEVRGEGGNWWFAGTCLGYLSFLTSGIWMLLLGDGVSLLND